MSRIALIRHGQSQSFQPGHALTPLGETQADRLACFWLRQGIAFDEVITGTLARQVRTEEKVAAAFQRAGRPWPEARRDPAWNEYDAGGILACGDARLAGLTADWEAARGGLAENRAFQKLLEAAMLLWMDGALEISLHARSSVGARPPETQLASGRIEPWPVFRDRVDDALARVMAGPAGRRVAVFTSGGPIGFAVHRAMQAPPRTFLDVNWRIRNLSVSEFLFDRERLTLDSFNCIAHLEEASLWSYR